MGKLRRILWSEKRIRRTEQLTREAGGRVPEKLTRCFWFLVLLQFL